MSSKHNIKLVAGTATVIGLLVGFFEKLFQPDVITLMGQVEFPPALSWIGFVVTALAALSYITVDICEHRSRRTDVVQPKDHVDPLIETGSRAIETSTKEPKESAGQ